MRISTATCPSTYTTCLHFRLFVSFHRLANIVADCPTITTSPRVRDNAGSATVAATASRASATFAAQHRGHRADKGQEQGTEGDGSAQWFPATTADGRNGRAGRTDVDML